jgi:hypothetical protein
MRIEYDHAQNRHTVDGPRNALPFIFAETKPRSLLDVGCGLGTWLKAALEFGVQDVAGVDGIGITSDKLLIPKDCFHQQDLTLPWSLGRRFDVALCLEVGEHLYEKYSAALVDSLVGHSDVIYFSAACPEQPGQFHVNCQWPDYWQGLFNQRGFACSDAIRWKIWDNRNVEWWYRQNMFCARKDSQRTGTEQRIPAVVHPEGSEFINQRATVRRIEQGSMGLSWYARIPFLALKNKLMRKYF